MLLSLLDAYNFGVLCSSNIIIIEAWQEVYDTWMCKCHGFHAILDDSWIDIALIFYNSLADVSILDI